MFQNKIGQVGRVLQRGKFGVEIQLEMPPAQRVFARGQQRHIAGENHRHIARRIGRLRRRPNDAFERDAVGQRMRMCPR